MIRPKYVINLLSDNIRKTRNPLAIPNDLINKWWDGVENNGEWLFFTGMLYQLTPYIETVVRYLEKFENSKLEGFLSLSNIIPKFLFRLISLLTSSKNKSEANEILRGIYSLLNDAGIDVYYRPELDCYSGILLYDFGDDEGFEEHAKFVAENLEKAGVKKIVTVDPHTTYALKVLYPKYAGKSFEVKNYLELLEGRISGKGNGKVVIHDPCYYGRYLEISEKPRKLLESIGVEYANIRNSGNLTSCCGGPIEALSPKISRDVAKLRLEELGNGRIVTMCPVCMANLRRAGGNTEDIALLLRRYSNGKAD
ncbi:hypothetical protein Asulf_00641 [Archaeoglobus sulfaticallidus PM70-1]|uniref:Cysteine-rich domain-containing protein n=1 Tax=Archaeoglobus sulfaticallidus PM70-1 TaxID=387631 RepID=N0BAL8_9EURY|nr:(Fe-S)-binding protein [Archaeoglobus sulfaticallidus]AGK60659.1 hypothetical protein Asulf_00641 [Archaeoglobus sulfaticallidus PM70-1]